MEIGKTKIRLSFWRMDTHSDLTAQIFCGLDLLGDNVYHREPRREIRSKSVGCSFNIRSIHFICVRCFNRVDQARTNHEANQMDLHGIDLMPIGVLTLLLVNFQQMVPIFKSYCM